MPANHLLAGAEGGEAMSDTTTQDKLDQALGFVLQTAEDAKGFVLEQAPLVAQEIVAWAFARSVFGIACGAVALVCGLLMVAVGVRHMMRHKDFEDSNPLLSMGGPIFGGVLIMMAVGTLHSGVQSLIKVNTAPRLVVIDYIRAQGH